MQFPRERLSQERFHSPAAHVRREVTSSSALPAQISRDTAGNFTLTITTTVGSRWLRFRITRGRLPLHKSEVRERHIDMYGPFALNPTEEVMTPNSFSFSYGYNALYLARASYRDGQRFAQETARGPLAPSYGYGNLDAPNRDITTHMATGEGAAERNRWGSDRVSCHFKRDRFHNGPGLIKELRVTGFKILAQTNANEIEAGWQSCGRGLRWQMKVSEEEVGSSF